MGNSTFNKIFSHQLKLTFILMHYEVAYLGNKNLLGYSVNPSYNLGYNLGMAIALTPILV
jgi:hypothetical protein